MKITTFQFAACATAAALFLGIAVRATPTLVKSSQQQNQQDASKQDPKQQDKDKDQKKKGQQGGNDAQQGAPPNPPPANPPPKPAGANDKPAPLFGGTLNLKSSRQTKDSATLGFNGVDPNGQVQKSFLSAAATGADNAKAAQVAGYSVSDADLTQFIQDGGLSQTATPQKSSN